MKQFVRGDAGDVFLIQKDLPRRRLVNAGEDVEQGSFACTIRTDQARDCAFSDFQGCAVYRAETAKLFSKIFNDDHGPSLRRIYRRSRVL